MSKRNIVLVLMLAGALLVACGAPATPTTAPANTPAPANTTAPAPTTAPAAATPTTAAAAPTTAPTAATGAVQNPTLPADAAPADKQVLKVAIAGFGSQ